MIAWLRPRRVNSPIRHSDRLRPIVEQLEDRLVPSRPLPLPVIYAGAGIGMSPVVTAIDAETGGTNFERTVFEETFRGGVRVAVGDFTRDGFPDVVVAAGPTGGPRVRILDGKSGNQITGPLGSFYAYDPAFTGGVHVAAADVDGDRTPDVITAAGPGGGPHVKVFSGATGMILADFMAFDPNFHGGITVAAADLTGDGKAEVAVGAGLGGGPRVKVYDPLIATPIAGPLGSFFAFEPNFNGGVFVGADALAGDVDADGTPDLAVGTGPGVSNRVRVFSGKTGAVLRDLTPFGPDNAGGGARPALAYVTDDSYADAARRRSASSTATPARSCPPLSANISPSAPPRSAASSSPRAMIPHPARSTAISALMSESRRGFSTSATCLRRMDPPIPSSTP